jgi:hypothetical protein
MISQSTKVLARKQLVWALNVIELNIAYDKAKIAYHWEHSDKNNAIDTSYHFEQLNLWKNDIRKNRKSAASTRKALKELK